MFEILTNTEKRIMGFSALGFPSKEIAIETGSTENTINTHLKNIKEKIGRNYKLSELRFFFICEALGECSESVKKQILSGIICIVFLITVPYNDFDKRRLRFRTRRENIERVEIYSTL